MSEIQEQLQALVAAELPETIEAKCDRYEKTLLAFSTSSISGADFGDWVQAACEDALSGLMPECPKCGTDVHEGACVSEDEEA